MFQSAILLAAATVVVWSILTIGVRASLHTFAFEPWTFALVIQIAAGAALLALAGFRSLPLDPIRRWTTWVIGGLRVVTTCCFSAALLHATAGQVSLLTTINVLLATVGVFLVFRRRRRAVELPGFLVIIVGLFLLVETLDGGWSNMAVRLILLSETSVVIASLFSERHPDNLGTRKQRLALTGFVMLIASVGLLGVWGVVATMLPGASVGPASDQVMATLASPWLWICAGLLGAVLRGPGTYAAFEITARLGADGYMLAMAGMAPMAMTLERLAALAGILPMPRSTVADFAVAAVVLAGSGWVIFARTRR